MDNMIYSTLYIKVQETKNKLHRLICNEFNIKDSQMLINSESSLPTNISQPSSPRNHRARQTAPLSLIPCSVEEPVSTPKDLVDSLKLSKDELKYSKALLAFNYLQDISSLHRSTDTVNHTFNKLDRKVIKTSSVNSLIQENKYFSYLPSPKNSRLGTQTKNSNILLDTNFDGLADVILNNSFSKGTLKKNKKELHIEIDSEFILSNEIYIPTPVSNKAEEFAFALRKCTSKSSCSSSSHKFDEFTSVEEFNSMLGSFKINLHDCKKRKMSYITPTSDLDL
jgi:hypothetical protein